MRRMFRYVVPVDDQAHKFHMAGVPLCVGNGPNAPYEVEFWAENDPDEGWVDRRFQVFGTGHVLPSDARYVGTAPRTPEGLVWHLYELGRK